MLTAHDDFLLHQTAEPLAQPATGDRNFYDRHFFNGFLRDGTLFFGAALGLYPNRRVMDASFSVLRGGVQTSLHASRLAPAERGETRVGPLAVEVVEPLRALRLRLGANDSGVEAALEFRARTAALEEPRFVHRVEGRLVMDSTRFTQWGTWSGRLRVDGEEMRLDAASTPGIRDRSWGVRPVGEREAGAPGPEPQFFWLWAPLHFEDGCTHFSAAEDGAGRPWHLAGFRVPLAAGGAAQTAEPMASAAHRLRWEKGTRRVAAAELTLLPFAGEPLAITLEPLLHFPMLGLGYLHPEWGHGLWKGAEAASAERWKVAELAPLDPRHLHVQTLCRARTGGREGIGVLEQLAIGPHAPSGFRGLLDGAP
jgi:hypothetical protein